MKPRRAWTRRPAVKRTPDGSKRSTPARTADRPRRRQRAADVLVARQAAHHSKIRRDHSAELAEDYVEMIAQLLRTHGEARTVDIAQRLGVTHVTVNRTISRLMRDGLARSAPYRSIFLTEKGEALAHQSEIRHALVVRFLRKLGVNPADAEADAEGIEHHLSAATLAAIRRFVGASR